MTIDVITLQNQAQQLRLHGLLAHWHELTEPQLNWLSTWLNREMTERNKRGIERRLSSARIGRFRPLSDFDWTWPDKIDQHTIHELMQLEFIPDASNVVPLGNNGVGKSTIAQNLAWQAAVQGYSVLFTNAAEMLNGLAAEHGDSALKRRLRRYANPQLLVIDEVGYLSYGDRHADLLFQIISQRYEQKSTIVTTNRPFSEWGDVFPTAACVVALVDKLIHHSEVIAIEGKSYRMKEATEKAAQKRRKNGGGKNHDENTQNQDLDDTPGGGNCMSSSG